MASTSGSQPQQINVADLNLQQLSDVRRQLEEVACTVRYILCISDCLAGAEPPHQLVRSAEASTSKVQVMHRERWRDQASK